MSHMSSDRRCSNDIQKLMLNCDREPVLKHMQEEVIQLREAKAICDHSLSSFEALNLGAVSLEQRFSRAIGCGEPERQVW